MQEDQIIHSESGHKHSNKRNSGIFSFLKWFQTSSTSRECVNESSANNSLSDSTESIQSDASVGTVASFSYLPPASYTGPPFLEKCISAGPETDTYKARLKERDNRRETDKNITLRKKYNLFFNRSDTKKESAIYICRNEAPPNEEVSCKSLPLMTRKQSSGYDDNEKYKAGHRRANSDCSKNRKSGAYLHVKGKRKAPQPPLPMSANDDHKNTFSLVRRSCHLKKRLAPAPPSISNALATDLKLFTEENNTNRNGLDNIFNDSLKLDCGVLKPTKDEFSPTLLNTSNSPECKSTNMQSSSVSPKPWYKRSSSSKSKEINNEENGNERLAKIPSSKKDGKRRLGLAYLANISELDKEAAEILSKKELTQKFQTTNESSEFKGSCENFVCHKDLNMSSNQQNLKRKTARDLIVKFDAIANVTKVKQNSSFFSSNENKQQKESRWSYFNRPRSATSNEKVNSSQNKDENEIFLKCNRNPLMKSESSYALKSKAEILPEEPNKIKNRNKQTTWRCQKCQLENDFWRIICYKCYTMKVYFEDQLISDDNRNNSTTDLSSGARNNNTSKIADTDTCSKIISTSSSHLDVQKSVNLLERSKTQIDFSIHTSCKERKNTKMAISSNVVPSSDKNIKNDEKERLKKMLIDMKNSLPKRKKVAVNLDLDKKNATDETPQSSGMGDELKLEAEIKLVSEPDTAEMILVTTQTVYENIKVKIPSTKKHVPLKVSSSIQTNAVIRKPLPISLKLTPCATRDNLLPASNHKIEYKGSDDDGNNVGTNSTQEICNNILSNPNAKSNKDVFIHLPKREEPLTPVGTKTNNSETLEINKLLRRLETAIARGDLMQASEHARDLAFLKVNCSVVRQKDMQYTDKKDLDEEKEFTIDMFVEDRLSHRGPFPIHVRADLTVLQLKQLVAKDYEIPVDVQKWILGKELAANDNSTLQDYEISNGCAVFLYLVASVPIIAENSANECDHIRETKVTVNSESRGISKTPTPENINFEPDKEQPKHDTEFQEISNMPEISTINKNHNENNCLIFHTTVNASNSNIDIFFNEKQKISDTNIVPNAIIESQQAGTSDGKIYVTSNEKPVLQLSKKQSPRANIKSYLRKEIITKPMIENEWVCQICTLLNPVSTNICKVCANVRSSHLAPSNQTAPESDNEIMAGNAKLHYQELINLDNTDLVPNNALFDCLICFEEIKVGAGVILRECLHQFCKACLATAVEYNEDAEVQCPFRDEKYACNMVLQTREIRALVTKTVYDQFLTRSIRQAENKCQKTYHCKTPDCEGWCFYEDNINQFRCPVCRKNNCMTCQAIHDGVDCRQYQKELLNASVNNEESHRTRVVLNDMVRTGDALHCPSCQVILMKKWGCDWVRCTVCKTEICWVTKGARWGPGGKGDTSGGCKCGVNGVKCHPQCSYCH